MKRKLFILFALLASAVGMKAQEAYAVVSEDKTTLTFYYDNNKNLQKGTVHKLNSGHEFPDWNDRSIQSVIFTPSFVEARPTSTCGWFSGMSLSTIQGLEYLNTQNVTDMSYMFSDCWGLWSLDLRSFDTQNVTDMSYMFNGCEPLESLNVSSFDTRNVTNMKSMFSCPTLTSLDLSSFDTQNVTDMSEMFFFIESLESLDLSHFDTHNVTNMKSMFNLCASLTSLDLSSFNTQNVTDMSGMFSDCCSLTSLDVSNFDTQNVTDMGSMFEWNYSLTSLNLSSFDTRNVTNMERMFGDCTSLSHLIISTSLGNSLNYTQECMSVGSEDNPCIINQPDGFVFLDFGEYVDTSGEFFKWADGYFKLEKSQTEIIDVNTDLGYITYCSDKALDFTNVEGMKAYIVVGYDGKVAKLSRIGIVPPETGLLLKAEAGEYEVPYTEEDNYVMNMLIGVLEGTTLSPTEGNMTNLVLANGKNGLGFYCLKGSGTIAAHRAYLQVPTRLIGNGAKFISMEFDDEVTAISGITTQEEAAPYYDLQGIRHEGKPSKQGIYIMNGKKVVVKD